MQAYWTPPWNTGIQNAMSDRVKSSFEFNLSRSPEFLTKSKNPGGSGDSEFWHILVSLVTLEGLDTFVSLDN